jgi:hypothetical protein
MGTEESKASVSVHFETINDGRYLKVGQPIVSAENECHHFQLHK